MTMICSSRKKNLTPFKTIDYLCVGHLTEDVTPDGIHLGGSAAYSTLTAKVFHINCGLITSYLKDQLPDLFTGIDSYIQVTDQMVRFENQYHGDQRIQFVPQDTAPLSLENLPERFRNAKVTHFGPILNDYGIAEISKFKNTFIGITPQGWLRESHHGKIRRTSWERIKEILPLADAVIISQEDIDYNQQTIVDMAKLCKLFVVTKGFHGATIYNRGEQQHFQAPVKQEIDPTGAGDIFSTAFFILCQRGYTPWLAGKIATDIASVSVTRTGLESIPTPEEINQSISHHTSQKAE